MTLAAGLAALGGALFFMAIVAVAIVVVLLLVRVFSKSRESGVVFRDGLTKEEADIVLKTVGETFTAQRVADTLVKVQSALATAVAKTKQ